MSKRLFFLFHLNWVTKKMCSGGLAKRHTTQRQWPINKNQQLYLRQLRSNSGSACLQWDWTKEGVHDVASKGNSWQSTMEVWQQLQHQCTFCFFHFLWFDLKRQETHSTTRTGSHSISTTAEPQKRSQGLARCGRTNLRNVSMPFVMSQTQFLLF